ncbi:MAG: 2Fe-2S iron-sulfur cluster-binding protein, partial [Brevibacterium sp.]
EIAEEIAASTEEYYESQPAALDMYEPEYDADGPVEAVGAPVEAVDAEAVVPVDDEVEIEVVGLTDGEADGETDAATASAPASTADDEAAVVDPAALPTVGEGEHTLSFVRSGLNVRVGEDDTVLQAARKAGVKIPANCQEGMCGSCKVVKLEGDVDMNHQGGIRAREIDAGKFLPCCSTAKSDLVIDA